MQVTLTEDEFFTLLREAFKAGRNPVSDEKHYEASAENKYYQSFENWAFFKFLKD